MLPPVWARRLLIAPGVAVGVVALLAAAPAGLLVAALVSTLVPGRWRPLRFLWFLVVYALVEAVALVVLFFLWLASGFGYAMRRPAFQRAHYRLAHWFLRVLDWEARRVLHVRVRVEGVPPAVLFGRPLVVCSRHAGPGDSFLVVHTLLDRYGREPRIVLKDSLQWDPAIDTLLNRLPNRFISAEPGAAGDAVVARIAELAYRLDGDDALVIFPEGGNFTPSRRLRAIERLQRRGLVQQARHAEALRHVLAPRPGGVAAAVGASPDADVVFVAHTGLEHLATVRDLWRGLPMDTEVLMHWWHVPAAEVPREPDAVAEWLFGWWATIDNWIDARRRSVMA